MPAEQMGQISPRLRLIFAVTSILFLLALAISPIRDFRKEWKRYKRAYVRFAETRPDTKRLLADYRPQISQIWLPDLGVVDRCTTCHQGITQPTLINASVPQPFRAHPSIPHPVLQWGCTACHRGQGAATETTEAHETTLAWEQPLLPVHFIQASCGTCHRADLPETPQLDRGRALLVQLNCVGCHRLRDVERPQMLGPDLTSIGTKVSRQWIYKWLKEPRTITDSNGNVTVNGYATGGLPRMPQFRLTEQELRDLSGYLSTLQSKPVKPYHFEPRVLAGGKTDPADQGELRFRQMFCSTCHSLSVTRAGTTSLIGGDIGPELTKVGSKANPEWLIAWLRDPQDYLPHSKMPRYQWSDADLYDVTQYITKRLTDTDLLTGVPELGTPTTDEIQRGRRVFIDKGCASCHVIQGIPVQRELGPDLSAIGARDVSQLSFGESKIPRNLIAYLQAKITDPLSVNSAARMPVYHLPPEDLDALTTALLSMTGPPTSAGLQKLVVSQKQGEFHPAGEFGRVYERYKCYVCHQFNGFGGTLAPDLSYEGSRAQRQWLIDFLKDPKTVRPTLVLRMPQFNMTDQEATTLATYIGAALNSPQVDAATIDMKQFTPEKAAIGKQLFEGKYACQSCHTIGATGGYVGPNLNNAGNWLTPAWIEAWLRNPQALVPDTIEPRRAFTDDEIQALTAYLLTLRVSGKQQAATQVARAANRSRKSEERP
ncbi:MAG TPA: c-type cytochrome [Candidatus Acidoferrales bacterium]|jgi:mono/diheme cytochrome c family protein|nr:c-type cytochrome [Verrucomicrobiae bacterium]HZP33513.1 c-type cytochrome [Candidatus Acidoferrales bacterium]